MIEKVKFYQEGTIDQLLQLENEEGEQEYFVKAPTGSGKTYMQAYLISQLINKYPNCKIIYQSLSKGSLAKQSYESIEKYNFQNINPYLLTTDKSKEERLTIPTNYNTYFLPRDLNKDKGLLKNPLKDFFTYKTRNDQKFLIIDECHEAHTNIDEYLPFFDRVYGFSATPKKEQIISGRCVKLSEEECEEIQLIKTKKIIHQDDPIYPSIEDKEHLLDWTEKKVLQSLEDFKEIKKDYKDTGINPALIIQISNKTQGSYQKDKIIEILNSKGILWYYRDKDGYESSDKINELKGANRDKAWEYVKNNNSNIDVIIFKLAINVGVDIPRACYLLQIRNTQSETLDEQVIGRIRRNPKLLEWYSLNKDKQEKLLIAYVNGVEQQSTRDVKFVRRKQNVFIQTTKLINKIPNQLRNIDKLNMKKYENEEFDIFQLKECWDKLDGRIKSSFQNINKKKWIELCINVDLINKQSFNYDYTGNIEKNGDPVGLQEKTFYRIDKDFREIEKWNWENDDKSIKYFFESYAEAHIAEELDKLGLELWGKNFYNKSKIRFEYFLHQKGNILISKQCPDFFVVKNNKKYLIEVKSLKSTNSSSQIDRNDYAEKVNSIKKAYNEISKVTRQIMVVIVEQEEGGWVSYIYEDGNETKKYNNEKLDFLKN